jgi:SAM-dependent methyltransferase
MSSHPGRSVTRGHGLLEGFLASKRSTRANRLIPDRLRPGRILDIGCGSYPVFLLGTRFAERFGIDREAPPQIDEPGLTVLQHDVSAPQALPFEDDFFDVVTMLAVFEHLEMPVLSRLLNEIHRVLRPGGVYVLTTPAAWTAGLLGMMSRAGLVSRDEVGEHKGAYTHREIVELLESSGFERAGISYGSFEAGMNLWVRTVKAGGSAS